MVNFWECFICVWKEGLFCIWHYLATYSHQMELKRKVCYSNSLKSLVNLIYWFLCIHIVHRSDCFILSFLYFSPFLLFPFCSCVIIHIDPAQWPHFHGGLQLLSTLKNSIVPVYPFHYVIYVAQSRSNSKERIYILTYPFHLQQTVNKPKELQQQQEASITHPSWGSSHLAHDSEANSGAAFCYSGLSSSPPEGTSTWYGWRQVSFPNCDGTRMWSRIGPVLLFSQLKFLLEVNAATRSKMLILREWWAQLLLLRQVSKIPKAQWEHYLFWIIWIKPRFEAAFLD